jgi:hypothetical protein
MLIIACNKLRKYLSFNLKGKQLGEETSLLGSTNLSKYLCFYVGQKPTEQIHQKIYLQDTKQKMCLSPVPLYSS